MRRPSLALLATLLVALPASAVEIVELRNGKLIEAERVEVRGDRLRIRLYQPRGDRTVEYALPLDRVVPEFVYYAWRDAITPGDVEGHLALAEWARSEGLFRLALLQYEIASDSSVEVRQRLPGLRHTLADEEATWRFERAWQLFREGEVHDARVQVEALLEQFADSSEAGRAGELLGIIEEREQFLSEQKKQEEIDRRARKHRRELDRVVDGMLAADRSVRDARMTNPVDAERRLRRAAYTYRQGSYLLEELVPYLEVDDLRLMVRATVADLADRRLSTFLKLGDLRLLRGDRAGALDAAHEVFAIDPDNARAKDLRDRVLDGPAAAPVPVYTAPGIFYARRLLRRRPHAYPLPVRHRLVYPTGIGTRYRGSLIWTCR